MRDGKSLDEVKTASSVSVGMYNQVPFINKRSVKSERVGPVFTATVTLFKTPPPDCPIHQ